MKPIYKSVAMASVMLVISLQLSAELNNAGEVSSQSVMAEDLQGLSVKLVSPNVSGAKDLIASGDCELSDEHINVNLSGLAQGTHRMTVSAQYGTQTVVLYALDIVVPAKLAEGEQEFEDKIVAVSTYADGDNSGADASVYAKDGDGNAHITKPLSVGDGVAGGNGAVASGYAEGAGSQITASVNGAVASGHANGENSQITASGDGAVASGHADDINGDIEASGSGSQAFGIGTKAAGDGQMVLGKCNVVDQDGDYALIVGNGTADNARSNAFAIDWQGNLVLFNAGTPVVLTPAKLAQLIA